MGIEGRVSKWIDSRVEIIPWMRMAGKVMGWDEISTVEQHQNHKITMNKNKHREFFGSTSALTSAV